MSVRHQHWRGTENDGLEMGSDLCRDQKRKHLRLRRRSVYFFTQICGLTEVFIFQLFVSKDDVINPHALCNLGEPIVTLKTTTVQSQVSRDFLIISPQTSQVSIRDAESCELVYKASCNAEIIDTIIEESCWDGFGPSSSKSTLYCRTFSDEIAVIDVMVSGTNEI
jgi:hypothetical protein